MTVIEVDGVTKSYPGSGWKFWQDREPTQALNGVNFSVEEGEIFGIVGPNGAGKTTMVNILTGLLYKDTGSVKIFGKETQEHRQELAERMNVATAYSVMSYNLTVDENLRVFAKIYDVDNARQRIGEVLGTFEISDLRHKPVRQLSAGQKTRANLAKSFINKPELLLLDEATAGLDPHIADITRQAIRDINTENDTTIILTSHNMTDIDELSDRMLFLHEGEVLRTGTPHELKKDIHVKELRVTVDTVTPTFRDVVENVDGHIRDDTATIKIQDEEQIVAVLDEISDLDITIIDIEATNPDLTDVFKQVARGSV